MAGSRIQLRFRKPIDTFMPSVGLLYRQLRDISVARAARRTEYGFTLAGSPIQARADFEPHEVRAFLELLDSHDMVIDIGANVGFYSCLAASRRKKVVSIEPSPRNLKFLYRNLWENRFLATEVFPLGLAEQPGLKRLYGFGGIASFVPGWAQADKRRFVLVPITSLDTIVTGRLQGCKLLIKIDVEGFELDVLAGGKTTLGLNPKPTWLIEVHLGGEALPTGSNAQFSAIFELFWAHGYQCKKLNAQREPVSAADVRRWVSNGTVDDGTHDFLFFDSGSAQ